jgi:hypothetical protein
LRSKDTMDKASFASELATLGFDEVLTRQWPPNHFVDTHTHPFAVRALMLEGELVLGCDGETRTYRAGDIFTLAPQQPHTEQYGSHGATYLVGRKHTAA